MSTFANLRVIDRESGRRKNTFFSMTTTFYGIILGIVYAEKQRYRLCEKDVPGHQVISTYYDSELYSQRFLLYPISLRTA